MKCSISNKLKALLVIALVVIVAGMVMLGVFGLNKPVDYEDAYEMQVSISLSVKDSSDVAKTACDEFFKNNDIKIKDYATQTADDGALLIYKTAEDYSAKAQALKEYVDNALQTKAEVKGVTSEVKTFSVKETGAGNTAKICIALAIIAVVTLVYLLIVEKFTASLSVVVSAIASAILFLSVISIARIPAYPFMPTMLVFAFALAGILSTVIVNRFKDERINVGNNKYSNGEIVDVALSKSKLRIRFVGIIVLVFVVPLGILAKGYETYLALQLLVADVVSILASKVFTPIIFLSIKKADKNK